MPNTNQLPKLLDPDLAAFIETVRRGSVSSAARRLGLSQPALSSRLARLKAHMKVELFHRKGRRLELTAHGTRIYESALRVLRSCEALDASIRSESQGDVTLRVGASDSVPKVMVRRVLTPYLRAGLRVECREWRTDLLERELIEHRLEMLITDRQPIDVRDEELQTVIEGRSTILLCARKDLAPKLKSNFPECLSQVPLAVPAAPSALREKLDRWISREAPTARIALEAEDRALLHQVAAAGLAVCPVAKTVSRTVLNQYGLAQLAELAGVTETYYCVRAKRRVPTLM